MTEQKETGLAPSPSRIMDIANAFYDSCVLFTASDLGIFACLSRRKSAPVQQIASDCGLDNRACTLLLNGCVALNLLEKDGELYSNSEESAVFLTPDSPADLSKALRYNRDVYPAWSKLPELVKTGKPIERPEIHLGDDPDRTRAFVLAMHSRAMAIGRAVVSMLDLSGRTKLLDIGGGPGAYSTLLAQANPDLRCTFIDLPGVVKVADELIAETNVADRVTSLPGDYHSIEFPTGNDVVTIFGVLHQESPDSILDIATRAFASLESGGSIHIMDMMTDETGCSPKFSALFGVNMALTTQNGWVFSSSDMSDWLTQAGFSDIECNPLPAPMPHWLMSARKP